MSFSDKSGAFCWAEAWTTPVRTISSNVPVRKTSTSKQIFHAEQNVHFSSQCQWPSVSRYWKLHTAFGDKPRMRCVLKPRRKIVFGSFAAGYRHTIKTTRSSMNKRCFQNKKQFAAGFVILAWQQDVFKIGV